MTKRGWRAAGAALALLLLLPVLALLALHTAPARRYLLQKAQAYLLEQGLRLEANDINYSLAGATLRLNAVRLTSATGQDLPPFLEARRATLDVGAMSYLKGFLHLQDARFEGLRLRIVTDEHGRSNVPVLARSEAKPEAKAPEFLIEHLEAPGLYVLYDDQPNRVRIEFPAARIRVDGRMPFSHRVLFATEQPVSVQHDGRDIMLDVISATADLPGDMSRLALHDLQLRSGASRLQVTGHLEQFNDPRMFFEVRANLALEQVAPLLSLDEPLRGSTVIAGTLAGTAEDLTVRGNITGHRVRYREFHDLSFETAVDWQRQRESVRLDAIKLDSPDFSARGSGLLVLSDESGSSATLDVLKADLAALSRRLEMPIMLDSRAAGKLAATWPGLEFGRASGQAEFTLSQTRGRAETGRLPVGGLLKIRLQDSRLHASIRRIQIPGLVVEGNATVDSFQDLTRVSDGRLSGEIGAEITELNSLYPNLLRFLGKDSDQTLNGIEPGGTGVLSASLSGTPSAPAVSASLEVPSLAVGNLRGIDLKADAQITLEQLDLPSLAIQWKGQVLRANGVLGFSGPSSPLRLQLSAENLDIEQMLGALGQHLPVSGIAKLRAEATGTIGAPRAQAQMRVSSLRAYSEPLGSVTADVSLDDRMARVERLLLDKSSGGSGSSGTVELTGSFDLDSQLYEIAATGNRVHIEGFSLPGQSPLAGVLQFQASGSGTLSDPALDFKLTAEDLRFEGHEIQAVQADGQLRNRTASFKVAAPLYRLQADGQVGIDQPYPADIEASISQVDLAAVPASLLGTRMEGRLTARAKATGELTEPRRAEVQATVTELVLKSGGRVIENEGPAELAYSGEKFHIRNVALSSGSSFLTLAGQMPLKPTPQPGLVEIHGSIDLGQILAGTLSASHSVGGKLTVDGSVAGSLESLAPTLAVSLQNGRFAGPELVEPVRDVFLQATVQDGRIDLTRLGGRLGGGNLEGRGEIPLGIVPGMPSQVERKGGPARLAFSADDFSLRSLAGVPPDVSGTLSLRADLEAADSRPEALMGTLTFNRLDLRVAGIDLRPDRPATVRVGEGKLRVEHFALIGPETRIQAAGLVGLTGERELDLRVNGRLDLALLSVFAKDVEASGESQFRVEASGTFADPRLAGFVGLQGGQVAVQSPAIQLNDLRARLDLEGNGLTIREFNANMNGGSLAASGSAILQNGLLKPNLEVKGRGVFLDFPEGLQTVSDADVTVRSDGDVVNVGGRVQILQGSYTDQLNLEERLLGLVGSDEPEALSERDPLLARVRFNVAVESLEPVVMDNNLARVGADLNLRLVGDYYRPGVLGRVGLDEGGELYLRERTYYVERGVISFSNPAEIEPTLDLSARTQVRDTDITLRISGTGDTVQTSLTSDPPMPETDLASLLVTGRTLEEARGEAGTVLREQTLSLLTGTVGGRVEEELKEITGLSEVRIEPNLIAPESDPTARLTIGQDLTAKLGLIYSLNLADSSDRIYIGEYDVTRRFIGRVVHETDPQDSLEEGSKYRFEVRHDLRLGGSGETSEERAAPRHEERRRITALRFEGQSPFTEKQLKDKFDVDIGDKYDFFKVRRGMETVKSFLMDREYLEASVRLSRENTTPESVALALRVDSGPIVRFRYEGFQPGSDTKRRVRESWSKGVFDELRLEMAGEAVRSALLLQGYMEAKIEHETRVEQDNKEVVFRGELGPQYHEVTVEFEGVSPLFKARLEEEFSRDKLAARVQTSFQQLDEQIRRVYRGEGYLQAEVGAPVPRLDSAAGRAVLVLPIKEGPRAELTQIEFEGNSIHSDADLASRSQLAVGQVFRTADRDAAVLRLRVAYAAEGYNDAVITPETQSDSETGKVRLAFRVEENRKEVVRAIAVKGNGRTSERFVMGLLDFTVGDPFTPEKATRSRRALYDTGAFALAELETEALESAGESPGEKPVRVTVRVREVMPYRLQYGGFYDTERGLGAIADLTNRNTFGNAAVLGLRARYDDTFREGRLYFGQPQLGGLPFNSNAVAFVSREIRPNAGFVTDRMGFSVQQEKTLRNQFVLSWGYRFERDHTYEPVPDAFFDITLNVAPLTATFSRDVRDDILDASRGSFTSHNLEFAPKLLGSDLKFIRYFGQYFHYVPLSEPEEIPWSGGLRKSRLVYAGGVRLGLAHGFDEQRLVPSERFYAGGGTSIRGFEQDLVGPLDIVGDPGGGGQSLFIMNHELRFPLYQIFDGVGFFDLGNVYEDVRDLDFFDVRSSAGIGLRIRTPYFLLRGDLGFNLFPREGEKRSAFFFSIGQAF